METFYRRPLPDNAIAFSSVEGRRVFAEALAKGGLDGYFPLAEQFHTQAEPTFCGLGSLVVALNALAIDPGRLWKGPWRWFGEELLDCCVPLDHVRTRGLDLDELACLARCNGADVTLERADTSTLEKWRGALIAGARADAVVIVSYDRSVLGQTGTGHFSPLGGYHEERDLALILDVARFKYPPHWVSAERLWQAMHSVDPTTNKSRGWLTLRPRYGAHLGLSFSLRCNTDSWRSLTMRFLEAASVLNSSKDGGSTSIDTLIRAFTPLAAHLEMRTPTTSAHREAIDSALTDLQKLPSYERVKTLVDAPEKVTIVTVLLLASDALVPPDQSGVITALTKAVDPNSPLAAELQNVRAQLSALLAHVRESTCSST